MPGAAHETLVTVIRSHPSWFDALLKELGHPGLPPRIKVADSAVRVVEPIEVRPDALLVQGPKRGPWAMVELQRDDDPAKDRRWLLAASALFNERRVMGDVFVITHARAVATWAATVAVVVGPHGSRLSLEPVVITLTRDVAEALLATGKPELAVFAAWAVHHQRGAPAAEVVRRAIETTRKASSRTLQVVAIRAILNMLSDELRGKVLQIVMDLNKALDKIPEGPVHRYLRELFEKRGEKRGEARGEKRGEKRGEAAALLRVLERRGLDVDEATRARVLACARKATLDRWLDRAVTAATVGEVFDQAKATRAPAEPARKPRPRG